MTTVARKLAENAKALDTNKKQIEQSLRNVHQCIVDKIGWGECDWYDNYTMVNIKCDILMHAPIIEYVELYYEFNTDYKEMLADFFMTDGFGFEKLQLSDNKLVSVTLRVL